MLHLVLEMTDDNLGLLDLNRGGSDQNHFHINDLIVNFQTCEQP